MGLQNMFFSKASSSSSVASASGESHARGKAPVVDNQEAHDLSEFSEDEPGDVYHTSESRKQIGLVSAIFLYVDTQTHPSTA